MNLNVQITILYETQDDILILIIFVNENALAKHIGSIENDKTA